MSYTHGEAIKRIEASDGKRRVDIVARNDGLFQAYEQVLIFVEFTSEYVWTVGRMSGLYGSAQDAEHFARTMLNL